jgi:hypothetical protein
MRIMTDARKPLTTHPIRRDGWTPERRERFLEFLSAGLDVRRACKRVGMSRQAAYTLRRREPAFARAWDGALRSARAADDEAFLAMLPKPLRRTMSEMFGECNHRGSEVPPRTVSGLSGECKLRGAGGGAQDSVRVVAGV